MNSNELRSKYLNYFKSKGHTIVPSASLIPENDPTTLFTSAGMQPMIPYLLGEKHPAGTRIADSQKCFRTQDIEDVGDNRHTTFFEMLGNWSLGDYFKTEQITWMYDFLTKEVGLDPKNLYVTCFRGKEEIGIPKDEESAKLWQDKFAADGIDAPIVDFPERDGLKDGRIFYYDEKKNWWSRAGVPEKMPIGEPGGPDTEMFWDFGAELGIHEISEWKNEPCHVNCDCGRFVEIGNNVFMAYMRTENGFEFLKNKNVDFGGGLERMVAASNGNRDIFSADIFAQAIAEIESISGQKYDANKNDKVTYAFRVVLDHIRAATFLIADGAVPSNKDQGYFTRRLIRRAVRYARDLGVQQNFCSDVSASYISMYGEAYPDLVSKKEMILNELMAEEEKFRKTLERGLKEFDKWTEAIQMAMTPKQVEDFRNNPDKQKFKLLTGDIAFMLYTTYGFPIELIYEIAKERGISVDSMGFEEEMKKHQELSRSGAEAKFKGGLADTSEISVKYHTATHLLHAALRAVLGDHVGQKGSNITSERMRFDFTHPTKMTDEEKKRVEDLVNYAIQKNYPVTFTEMTVADAKALGAIGLFEDKYGTLVKVYSVGDPSESPRAEIDSPTFSKEICGGPHVEHTGTLGKFKIAKEEASSAGIRRIKAILEEV